jgi:pimeloyl-ACP methyl ester carboxylesterase
MSGDVAAIDVPTLIIHGDSEAIVPFEVSGKRSHEAIDGSELVLVEGGPHGVNATRPAWRQRHAPRPVQPRTPGLPHTLSR